MSPTTRRTSRFHALLALLATLGCTPGAHALTVSVGTGAGCTHATLQDALDALEPLSGDHRIHLRTQTHAVANGAVYQPTVAQGFVRIEGGYANCSDAAPSGNPAVSGDAARAVLDGAGGLPRTVLSLQIDGRVGSVQIRRVAIRRGDATGPEDRFSSGGGLSVFGAASVLLGFGTVIGGNTAVYGGGIAAGGSRTITSEPFERVDLFITEGAEIDANIALNQGGGIFCGGSRTAGILPESTRHASVVHASGSIINNQARFGSAMLCQGSYAGGGYQPRPVDGGAALVLGNIENEPSLTGTCPLLTSLDLGVVPTAGSSYRDLGAAPGESGVLWIANNRGQNSGGMCVLGYNTRSGASPPPATEPSFRLRNVWLDQNTARPASRNTNPGGGDFASALRVARQISELVLEPALDDCSLLQGGACVRITGNAYDGVPGATDFLPLVSGPVTLRRARIEDNEAVQTLFELRGSPDGGASSGGLRSSLMVDNIVAGASSTLLRVDDFAGTPGGSSMQLTSNTFARNTQDGLLQLDGAATAELWANVFTASTSPRLRFGTAAATNLTLRWCGQFPSATDPDYVAATRLADPGTGTFNPVFGSYSFDASFAPPLILRDRCTPLLLAPTRDFYGRPKIQRTIATGTDVEDLGAVEFVPDPIFADSFE